MQSQPRSVGDTPDADPDYPGRDLGRPRAGPGSIARPGLRFGSVLIDWVMCLVIARGFLHASPADPVTNLYPVLILMLENLLLVPTAGATVGQRLIGVQTERVDGGHLGLGSAAVRALLLGLFLPVISLIWQRDLRGGHDLAAGAVVVRTR